MINIINALKTEIGLYGMTPPKHIESGKITRFPDNGGRNQDGWCSLFINPDGSAGAAFGNWKDINRKWFFNSNGKKLSQQQQNELSKQVEQAREQARQERRELQATAAKKAEEVWNNAGTVNFNHAYLAKKQIKAYGLKQSGKVLIVPVYNSQKQIISLQQIIPDGSKKFLPGGKVQGGFFSMGDFNDDTIFIGEGYATMSTIHKTTGKSCIVAFNSGNLKNVAHIIQDKYQDKNIIIAADNDIETEKKTGINPGRKAATEAASAIGATICICPVNSDFNDLMVEQGIKAVREALNITNAWDKPVFLKEEDAPGFEPELLPGIIGAMARAVSNETETPFELAAGLILSVMGTACQGKFKVQVKPGYQEPVNIWTVTTLNPANRKSSVLMKITDPLNKWEVKKHSELKPWIKEAFSKRCNQESRIKSLRLQYGKASEEDKLKQLETEILEIEKNLEEVPVYPKVWAQDVTPEHLGTLLNSHNEVMSILSAEGGIFDILGGRYSNGIANLDLFLQGHSGDPVRVDRGSRDPVFLNNPALTLGLSPQPEVLKGLSDKKSFRGRGLLARFSYLLPKSNLGYRGLNSESIPDNVKNKYQNLIFQLLDIQPRENEFEEKQPYILKLSQGAYQEWSDFYMVVERDLREGGRFEHITDWAGKLPGVAARIAGLLHCSNNPDQPWVKDIDIETMVNALEIASILADHALIAFDMMGADKSLEQAKKIWRWVERGQYKLFTKRDCFHDLKGTFHRVVNMDEGFKVLIERNYLQESQIETGGRPSIQFAVNPEIIKGWS